MFIPKSCLRDAKMIIWVRTSLRAWYIVASLEILLLKILFWFIALNSLYFTYMMIFICLCLWIIYSCLIMYSMSGLIKSSKENFLFDQTLFLDSNLDLWFHLSDLFLFENSFCMILMLSLFWFHKSIFTWFYFSCVNETLFS